MPGKPGRQTAAAARAARGRALKAPRRPRPPGARGSERLAGDVAVPGETSRAASEPATGDGATVSGAVCSQGSAQELEGGKKAPGDGGRCGGELATLAASLALSGGCRCPPCDALGELSLGAREVRPYDAAGCAPRVLSSEPGVPHDAGLAVEDKVGAAASPLTPATSSGRWVAREARAQEPEYSQELEDDRRSVASSATSIISIETRSVDERLRLSFRGCPCSQMSLAELAHTASHGWEGAALPLDKAAHLAYSARENSTLELWRQSPRPNISGRLWSRWRRATLAAVFLAVVSFLALMLFVLIAGGRVAQELGEVWDVPIRGTPDYLGDFFGGQCLLLKERLSRFLLRLEAFNARWAWTPLRFPARGDGLEVEALLFPVGAERPPLVILLHDRPGNALDASVQAAAYMLRAAGVAALALNLRGHGGVGYDPLWADWLHQSRDVLGAFDFALGDLPGGPWPPGAVGVWAFGFGGLAAQAAFAAERSLGALLLQGAPHDLRALFRSKAKAIAPVGLEDVVAQQAVAVSESHFERPMFAEAEERAPELLRARQGGVVGVIHSRDDRVVPVEQAAFLKEALSAPREHPVRVHLEWLPPVEACEDRRSVHLERPVEYAARVCAFWAAAFAEVAAVDCAAAAAELGDGS